MTKALRQKVVPEDSIQGYCLSIFQGMNSQAFNTPIDLFIENFLFHKYPALRPFQFLSLYSLINEGINAVTNKRVLELTPMSIISKSKIYNMVTAIQFEELYDYDLLKEFNATLAELKQAQKFYDEYLEYRDDREPAEEYELVMHWAEDLKIDRFFELEGEIQHRRRAKLDTFLEALEKDPLGLEEKDPIKDRNLKRFMQSQQDIGMNMAVAMYMVDALNYFEGFPQEKIKRIAMEIAMQGSQGYSPDKEGYTINSMPDKTFSGNKILAYYYVSFALAVPDMLSQLQLPFEKEYELAKQMTEL